MKLNPKLLNDIKSFIDSAYLNYIIDKDFKVFMIFLLESKFWAMVFTVFDWLATALHDFI